MLFGKRGKSGLVKLNLSLEEAREFLAQNMDKEIEFQGKRGALTQYARPLFVQRIRGHIHTCAHSPSFFPLSHPFPKQTNTQTHKC